MEKSVHAKLGFEQDNRTERSRWRWCSSCYWWW